MESPLSINDKITQLRRIIDKYPEIKDIPDSLLTLSLTKNKSPEIPFKIRDEQKIKYGSDTYQRLEFLGDAVLELIVSDILFDNFNVSSPGELTILKSKLVRNTSLMCFIDNKDMCKLTISAEVNQSGKACADLFESIIGALYYYLKRKSNTNPLKFLSRWLNLEWNFETVLNYLITHPDLHDICSIVNITPDTNYNSDEPSNIAIADDNTNKTLFDTLYEQTAHEIGLDDIKDHVDALINDELIKLQDLSTDQLRMNFNAISKELSNRSKLSFKSQISIYYQRKRYGQVNYVVIQKGSVGRKWIIGVTCPIYLNCGPNAIDYSGLKIIGYGVDYVKKNAEELAAKYALEFLQNLIGS